MPNTDPKPRGAAGCPICGQPSRPAFRPFCSDRCKQVDLGRWLKGTYSIPGAAVEPDEDDKT